MEGGAQAATEPRREAVMLTQSRRKRAGAKAGASLAPNSPDVCVPVHVHCVFDVFRSLVVSCTVRNETVSFVEHL